MPRTAAKISSLATEMPQYEGEGERENRNTVHGPDIQINE